MVALPAVLPARVTAEIFRVVQIIAPAADIGNVHVRAVAGDEKGEALRGHVGKVQADIVFAAVAFQSLNGALFGGGVAIGGEGPGKIALAHEAVAEDEAALLFGEPRAEILVPHELRARRIVADAVALRPEIGQQGRDMPVFEFLKFHKNTVFLFSAGNYTISAARRQQFLRPRAPFCGTEQRAAGGGICAHGVKRGRTASAPSLHK